MADRGRSERSLALLVPEPVRTLPADLGAVVVLVVGTCLAALVPGVSETPLRLVLGLPFVLFLPGYALVAALFPEAGDPPAANGGGEPTPDGGAEAGAESASAHSLLGLAGESNGIDGIERVALSLGLSIAIVPLVGLAANFTPWGIRLGPILVAVAGFTLGTTAVAAVRRRSLPESERFRVPYREWIDSATGTLFEPESRLDGILSVVLVCSMLLAAGSVAYAVTVPPQGETFTEFYVLTEDENEELVAADYPSEFRVGESQPVVVGLGNHEGESVEYTVVVQLQEATVENNETVILDRQEIDRFSSPAVADNETWQRTHEIRPTRTGDRLRVQYLLYRGPPPAEPTAETAYRDLDLWIDVTGTGN